MTSPELVKPEPSHLTSKKFAMDLLLYGRHQPTVPEIINALGAFVSDISAVRHTLALRVDGKTRIVGTGTQADIDELHKSLGAIGLSVSTAPLEDSQ